MAAAKVLPRSTFGMCMDHRVCPCMPLIQWLLCPGRTADGTDRRRLRSARQEADAGEQHTQIVKYVPPEALPSELDIVLQLPKLVRLDGLVPGHDHLADELPARPHLVRFTPVC